MNQAQKDEKTLELAERVRVAAKAHDAAERELAMIDELHASARNRRYRASTEYHTATGALALHVEKDVDRDVDQAAAAPVEARPMAMTAALHAIPPGPPNPPVPPGPRPVG